MTPPLPENSEKAFSDDPCCAQGKRSYSASFEVEPKQPRKKTKNGNDSGFSSTPPQLSSSDSESMESEASDFQIQPLPSSRLLVSRRLSQQKLHPPRIDYSKLLESAGDGDTNEEDDDDDDDLDVEYVDPTVCYSRARVPGGVAGVGVGGKRRSRPRVEQLKRKYHGGGVARGGEGAEPRGGRKVEQKRNISSLFQPQSPLVNENMKVHM